MGLLQQRFLSRALSWFDYRIKFQLGTEAWVNFERNDIEFTEEHKSVLKSVKNDINQCHMNAVDSKLFRKKVRKEFRSIEKKWADFLEVEIQLNSLSVRTGVDVSIEIDKFVQNLVSVMDQAAT